MKLAFATRGSKLALLQTNHVMKIVKDSFPNSNLDKIIIKTLGDKVTNLPLFKVGGQGLFIKEIENSLLENKADIAVHSLKDMPSETANGLTIVATGSEKDYRDCFVSNKYNSLYELPPGSKIGTSSLRRRAQISIIRNDLIFTDFRGNLDTRLKKLDDGEVDAIILAAAGLNRFGWQNRIKQHFTINEIVPPAGQGILALECRAIDREKFAPFLKDFHTNKSMTRAKAERAFLSYFQAGCQTPIGVFAKVKETSIDLIAFISSVDGSGHIKESISGPVDKPEELGINLATKMIEMGGNKLVQSQEK